MTESNLSGSGPGTVCLLPRWAAGQRRRYQIVNTREKAEGGAATLEAAYRTDLDIEVIEAGPQGFVVGWTLGESRYVGPKQSADLVGQVAGLFKGMQTLLEIDSQGLLTGVRNWKDLKAAGLRGLDLYTDQLRAGGLRSDMVSRLRAQAAPMLDSKQQVEHACTREARVFLWVLGGTYTLSKPVESGSHLPNPFRGQALPCRVWTCLKSLDGQAGRAVVERRMALDSGPAGRIVQESLRVLAERLGKPAAPAGMTLSIEEVDKTVVEVPSGWIERADHTRTTTAGPGVQRDSVTITRPAP